VLLVEDNDTDVFVVRKIVRGLERNLQLQFMRDGAEALAHIASLDADESLPLPSLILLDLSLPKIGGIEVLRHLRANSRCKSVHVIVITSSDSKVDLEAVQELGVTAYFRKPADLSAYMELGDVISRVLPPMPDKGV